MKLPLLHLCATFVAQIFACLVTHCAGQALKGSTITVRAAVQLLDIFSYLQLTGILCLEFRSNIDLPYNSAARNLDP